MGFFLNKEGFPIGISLYRPTRGTKSDGKLNFIIPLKRRLMLIFDSNILIIQP